MAFETRDEGNNPDKLEQMIENVESKVSAVESASTVSEHTPIDKDTKQSKRANIIQGKDELDTMLRKLNDVTIDLKKRSVESNEAAQKMVNFMGDILKAAQEAAAAAVQSLHASQQIETSSKDIQVKSAASLSKTNNLQGLIRTMTTELEQLAIGVNEAARVNMEAAKNVKEMEVVSSELGSIIGRIAKIAAQTNLLAINAAIEAGRAGKHGRGFAVVADEVRNLAENARVNADDTLKFIKEIQTQVGIVSEEIEKVGQNGSEQANRATGITKGLESIESTMKQFQETINANNNMNDENLKAAVEIRKASEMISSSAQETTATINEANKSVVEQGKALKEILNTIDELNGMSLDMKAGNLNRKLSLDLAAAAEQLSASVTEANNASQHISTSLTEISSAADSQASAAEQSQSGATESAKAVRSMSERAVEAAEFSDLIVKNLTSNKLEVDELIVGIHGIVKGNVSSVEKISILSEKAKAISKTVDSIGLVSMQTNMLALNGAIEAARSGKYGKGFEVVAGDIKKLAVESANGAEEVKTQVSSLFDSIQKVMSDITIATQGTKLEAERARKTTSGLNNIETEAVTVSKGVGEVAELLKAAERAITEASAGITQIARMTQNQSKTTSDASDSSRIHSDNFSVVANLVQNVAGIARNIEKYIDQNKVSG
ncbi:MAG: hypothetical protein H7A23_00485 [Leptospiraceae bacterium]|nr:hypothetical protein [Leptospiraceae bacterium]